MTDRELESINHERWRRGLPKLTKAQAEAALGERDRDEGFDVASFLIGYAMIAGIVNEEPDAMTAPEESVQEPEPASYQAPTYEAPSYEPAAETSPSYDSSPASDPSPSSSSFDAA